MNVSSIKAKAGASWLLDLAQDSTAAEVREQVCVDPEEEVEMDGSRGTCNLQIGWGGESCKRDQACVACAAVREALL